MEKREGMPRKGKAKVLEVECAKENTGKTQAGKDREEGQPALESLTYPSKRLHLRLPFLPRIAGDRTCLSLWGPSGEPQNWL